MADSPMTGYLGSSLWLTLPNENILEGSKLKAFADDKMNVAQMMIPVFHMVKKKMW